MILTFGVSKRIVVVYNMKLRSVIALLSVMHILDRVRRELGLRLGLSLGYYLSGVLTLNAKTFDAAYAERV